MQKLLLVDCGVGFVVARGRLLRTASNKHQLLKKLCFHRPFPLPRPRYSLIPTERFQTILLRFLMTMVMADNHASCEAPSNNVGAVSTTADASQVTLPAKRPAPDDPKPPKAKEQKDSSGLPTSTSTSTSTASSETSEEEAELVKRSPPHPQEGIEGQNEEVTVSSCPEKLARWSDRSRFDAGYECDRVEVAINALERILYDWFRKFCSKGLLKWDTVRDCDKDALNTWAPDARHWLDSKVTWDHHHMISAWSKFSNTNILP
jgi:hypothetical protein